MLTADQARQLDRLAIAADAGAASAAAGRRPTRARGYSVEFHDFRPYQPGDDPRSIDWTIDARLRQLVVRMFRAEGHVPVHLLLDTSASMTLGAPAKLTLAAQVAAVLAYVAVLRRDPVALATFGAGVSSRVAPAAGRAQLFKIFDALAALSASGPSSIDASLTAYGGTVRGPGLAVVLSDFFDPVFRRDGLRFLKYRGFTAVAVQVLADDEAEPAVTGPIELTDVEDPARRPVFVDAAAVDSHRERLVRETAALRDFCAAHAMPWIQLRSSATFGDVVTACTGVRVLELHA